MRVFEAFIHARLPRCAIRARDRATLPLPYDFPRLLHHSGNS
jgi:hypothetical protein